jgi:hypothetical protein
MSGNSTNIVAFLLTTYVYFIAIKPALTYDKLSDTNEYKKYLQSNYVSLAIYLFMVMIIQSIVNTNYINTTCGGNTQDNIGYAGIMTIWPWTLIFGILLIIITIFPGFKSAFSDVIGYYWVSRSANELISELLIDKEIQPKIDDDKRMTPEMKKKMQSAADAIIKLFGNTGVIINQVSPRNFQQFWDTMTPLMKNEFKPVNDKYPDAAIGIREKLFKLVITRDNVGEAMWYIYTGLLVTSIVQLQISAKGCKTSIKTMEQNYGNFKEKESQAAEKKQAEQSTLYTL